jgi:hypothetical protein
VWYEGEEVEGADTGVNPLCSILYERAGKCNRHMDTTDVYNFASDGNSGQYQEQNEDENKNEEEEYVDQAHFGSEQEVCHFIDSLSPKPNDDLSRGILIGLIIIAAAAAVLVAGLASRRHKRKVFEKVTERSSSGAVWYPSTSGVSPIALLSKPFSEWNPKKSIAPTNDVRTTRKASTPANVWSSRKYIAPTNYVSNPRRSTVPASDGAPSECIIPTNDESKSERIAPTSDVLTPRKSPSHTQAARDESGVIGFGFDANRSRPLVVPSLGSVPLVLGNTESTKNETRVGRQPSMTGGCDSLGRAVLLDMNQTAGRVESASEKIDRLEAEMLQYSEETASIISTLSSS